MYWEVRLSTVIILISALGLLLSLLFLRDGWDAWLAFKVFFLFGLILRFARA